MTITKDAAELIALIYQEYTTGNRHIDQKTVFKSIDWDEDRMSRALDFLNESELIKITRYLGSGYHIDGLTPKGISTIENKDNFKKAFSFTVGIPGIISGTWGAENR